MMEIDDPSSGKLPADPGRENPHVPGEHNVIELILVKKVRHSDIVRVPRGIADVVEIDSMLLSNAAAGVAVADHDADFCLQSSFSDLVENCQRGLRAVRRA